MEREKVAWENRKNIGFLKALYQTVKNVLFRPNDFFSRMNSNGGFSSPLIFAIVLCILADLLMGFWDYIHSLIFSLLHFKNLLFELSHVSLLLGPLIAILILFVGSLSTHISLRIVSKSTNTFEATFRVFAYSCSTLVLWVFPIYFLIIIPYLIWSIVIQFIGLKKVHQISNLRCALAIGLSFLFTGVPAIIVSLLVYSR